MFGTELLRLIDSIHRDKGISKELLFDAIEQALLTSARKRWEQRGDLTVKINRISGELEAYEDGLRVDPGQFGRIVAQTAKQVIIQKIREAERDVIFGEFEAKIDSLVNGTVQRFEKGNIVINIGRTEGIVPKQEQVFSEQYRPGERIRAYVVKVQKKGQKVLIILSRTHPNLVKELFALEVPEIGDRIVEIKGIVREPGHRTKIAVYSIDQKVDAIGACVGVRGTRIRNIVEELGGEKIDIVRWSESPDLFIRNALSPAEINAVELDRDTQHAHVIVPEDQLSLAIGKKGQNVRLTAKLTHWHIDILTAEQARKQREIDRHEIMNLPDVPNEVMEKLLLNDVSSLHALLSRDVEHYTAMYSMTPEAAAAMLDYARTREQTMKTEEPSAASAAPAPVAPAEPTPVEEPAAPVAETAPASSEEKGSPA